jgi:hypothetical protein
MGAPKRDDGSRYWTIRTVLEVIKSGIWIALEWARNGGQGPL